MTSEDPSRAAEYVLGVMSAEERAAFARELAQDAALAAEVRDWEVRLAPLARDVADVPPPPSLFRRIESAIATSPAVYIAQAQRWRAAALGFAALSIGLALFAFLRPVDGQRYMAVIDRGGELPALVVAVDPGRRQISVMPVAAQAPNDRSLELWLVRAGQSPQSLGVIADQPRAIPAQWSASELAGASFAVSVEPQGGSTTGSPTGPVIYSGKLIEAPPAK